MQVIIDYFEEEIRFHASARRGITLIEHFIGNTSIYDDFEDMMQQAFLVHCKVMMLKNDFFFLLMPLMVKY